jgi:ferredoxin-thioredoxin reductase catalytic subunit
MNPSDIPESEVEQLFKELAENNKKRGYFLNPDPEFTKDLVRSLLFNEKRYGYQACPCRLATGAKADDLDIICPCDYRDADVVEYGSCFCGLYVSKEVSTRIKNASSIPERRPPEEKRTKMKEENKETGKRSYPVWRCKVCGYLCARDGPPDICPVCGVEKERFERFM